MAYTPIGFAGYLCLSILHLCACTNVRLWPLLICVGSMCAYYVRCMSLVLIFLRLVLIHELPTETVGFWSGLWLTVLYGPHQSALSFDDETTMEPRNSYTRCRSQSQSDKSLSSSFSFFFCGLVLVHCEAYMCIWQKDVMERTMGGKKSETRGVDAQWMSSTIPACELFVSKFRAQSVWPWNTL